MAILQDIADVIRSNPDQLLRKRANEAVRLCEVAAAGVVGKLRADLGLPPDLESDLVHVDRIRNGAYKLGEVRRRLEDEALRRLQKAASERS
jgi:hypothetical protein